MRRSLFGTLLLASQLVGLCSSQSLAQPFDQAPATLKVMTWNLEWMFDDYTGDNRSAVAKEQSAPSKEYWQARLTAVADGIAKYQPEIIALQEIEGLSSLSDIAQTLKSEYRLTYRFAFIQGSDSFTEQDVGLMFRGGLVQYRRHEQTKAMFDSQQYYNLSKHLVGEFRWADVTSPLTILNVHFRATPESEELRVRQARLARTWVDSELAHSLDAIVLGDTNSEHKAGQVAGDMAVLVGKSDGPQLVDLLTFLDDPSQPTHLVLDKQFDRILVSPSLMSDEEGSDWVFQRIEILREIVIRGEQDGGEHWDERLSTSKTDLDVSDHFPVMATFELR